METISPSVNLLLTIVDIANLKEFKIKGETEYNDL